jgi:hypothetical protein
MNSSLSPNVVKTALDDVFLQEHNITQHVGYVDANSGSVFNQETTDRAAEIVENFLGSGLWDSLAEEAEITQGQPRVTGSKTFTVTKFARNIIIPAEFFADNMHGAYEKMVKNFAANARNTRDKNAFAVFRNAFSAATTYDGTALISDTHTNLGGYTIDNKVTGAFSETTLNTAIIQLLEMKSQDGVVGGNMPSVLLVPPALFKTACEVTQSELRSGTANNDMNVYSSKYGIQVATSQWLGAAASGSDSAWFLLSSNHSIMRYVRSAVSTWLVPPEYSDNDTYKYGGKFREVVGALSFEGIVGSNGS